MEESGRVVGNYVLGSMLGRGSFAVVWRGKHVSTAKTVAVKEIDVKMLNAKLRQSLECEVSILQRVEHQNIVRLLETFEVKPWVPKATLPDPTSCIHAVTIRNMDQI